MPTRTAGADARQRGAAPLWLAIAALLCVACDAAAFAQVKWGASVPHPSAAGRMGAGCAAVNNQLVVFGGATSVTGAATNDLLLFDADTQQWTAAVGVAGQTPTARLDHSVVALPDRRLVVFGGRTSASSVNGRKDLHVLSFQSLPPAWHQPFTFGPAPTRYAHAATLVAGRLMVVHGGLHARVVCDELFVLDVERWSWSGPIAAADAAALPPPTPRFAHSAVTVGAGGSRVVIFGGRTSLETGATPSNEVHVLDYEAASNSWRWRTPLVGPGGGRAEHAAVSSAAGVVTVFGGEVGAAATLSGDVLQMQLDLGVSTAPLQTGQPPSARSGHCAAQLGSSRVLIFGGLDASGPRADVSTLWTGSSCAAGTYNTQLEAATCEQCPRGFYCPEGALEPVACADPFLCPAGSAAPPPEDCPFSPPFAMATLSDSDLIAGAIASEALSVEGRLSSSTWQLGLNAPTRTASLPYPLGADAAHNRTFVLEYAHQTRTVTYTERVELAEDAADLALRANVLAVYDWDNNPGTPASLRPVPLPLPLSAAGGGLRGSRALLTPFARVPAPNGAFEDARSLQLWVRFDALSGEQVLASRRASTEPLLSGWQLTKRGDNEIEFASSGAGNLSSQGAAATLATGAWFHVVVVLRQAAGTAHLYLNGAEVASRALPEGGGLMQCGTLDCPLLLGAVALSPTSFAPSLQGALDDAALWARELSVGQVLQLYAARASRPVIREGPSATLAVGAVEGAMSDVFVRVQNLCDAPPARNNRFALSALALCMWDPASPAFCQPQSLPGLAQTTLRPSGAPALIVQLSNLGISSARSWRLSGRVQASFTAATLCPGTTDMSFQVRVGVARVNPSPPCTQRTLQVGAAVMAQATSQLVADTNPYGSDLAAASSAAADGDESVGRVRLFTRVPWPYKLSGVQWQSLPAGVDAGAVEVEAAEGVSCADTPGSTCENVWRLDFVPAAASPGGDADAPKCDLDGGYNVAFTVSCHGTFNPQTDPTPALCSRPFTSSVRFSLASTSYCPQYTESLVLTSDSYSFADADHTIVKDHFLQNQRVYMAVLTTSTRVSLRRTFPIRVEVVRSGRPDLVLLDGGVVTAAGQQLALEALPSPASQISPPGQPSKVALSFTVLNAVLQLPLGATEDVYVRVRVGVEYVASGSVEAQRLRSGVVDLAATLQDSAASGSAPTTGLDTAARVVVRVPDPFAGSSSGGGGQPMEGDDGSGSGGTIERPPSTTSRRPAAQASSAGGLSAAISAVLGIVVGFVASVVLFAVLRKYLRSALPADAQPQPPQPEPQQPDPTKVVESEGVELVLRRPVATVENDDPASRLAAASSFAFATPAEGGDDDEKEGVAPF